MLFLLLVVVSFVLYRMRWSSLCKFSKYDILGKYEGEYDGEYEGEYEGSGRRFDLFMQDPWYDYVVSGKKTLEARLGGPDKLADLVGKTIKCKNGKDKITMIQITNHRHYKTLDDMIDKEKIDSLVPTAKSKSAAKEALMALKNKAGDVIYDKARVDGAGGIVVLEFKLSKSRAG